jgi:hypothetical protein
VRRIECGLTLRRNLRVTLLLIAATGTFGLQEAHASQQLGDLNVTNVSLAANAKGEALLTYTRDDGKIRHVLLWGAINARTPDPNVPQVHFETDYAGGWGKYRKASYWKTFKNGCRPYDGPSLVYGVTACTAPDGTYWAVQAWQRLLPMRGFVPFRPQQGAYVFNVSHWSGSLAVLTISQNWTYDGSWTGLFGRLTYDGSPVYGFRTPAHGKRGDGYARYAYIDTYNSVYGAGWKRDGAKVLHTRNGAFCYSFVPQTPPPGYPDTGLRGPAPGEVERVTVMGPGVTPDVQWTGPGLLGTYDPEQDAAFNRLFDDLVGPDDGICKNER